jgi:hypothetical protein
MRMGGTPESPQKGIALSNAWGSCETVTLEGGNRVGLLEQTISVASRFRWPDRPSISFVPSQSEVTDGSEAD